MAEPTRTDYRIDTVLVPLDVSTEHDRELVFALAEKMARVHDARLAFLAVVPEVYLATTTDPEGLIEQMKERSAKLLHALVARRVPEGVRAETLVRYGPVSGAIIDTAKELDAGLILIHARRPGIANYALGSVASRVANHAPCSVYVVRD